MPANLFRAGQIFAGVASASSRRTPPVKTLSRFDLANTYAGIAGASGEAASQAIAVRGVGIFRLTSGAIIPPYEVLS